MCRRVQCSSSLHDADDWTALRKQALGAAARGAGDPDDERLIAGARCWLALVDDHAAEAILRRPTCATIPSPSHSTHSPPPSPTIQTRCGGGPLHSPTTEPSMRLRIAP